MTYALDTNTISYWLQGSKQVAEHLSTALKQGATIVIPSMVYYEIRRGFKYKAAPGKESAFTLMCQSYDIGEMNLVAWEEAAEIYANNRRVGKTIDDTDILIAAFCIVNNYILVTSNIKHFQDISNLTIENWV